MKAWTLALALALALGTGAHADSGPVPLERLSLGELGGWMVLRAEIAGRNGRWLLDTGANRNLLAPDAARQLGLSPAGTSRADTALGAVHGGEVELPALRVGQLERRGQRALVVELVSLLGSAAEGVDGVLGVPWLEGLEAEFDLRAWSATFRAGTSGGCPEALRPITLTRWRALPVVSFATGAGQQRYVLDTGNPAGLVRIEHDAASDSTPGLVVPGGQQLTLLREASLGAHTRTDVPVTRLGAPALKRALGDAALGLAGTALLDGARWQLDLAANRLCVEVGRFATPGGFGLVPERRGETLQVQLVLPGSPAEQAGLRAGETISQWAGLPASRPLAELWQAVQGREEIVLSVGDLARELRLKRALFAPAAP